MQYLPNILFLLVLAVGIGFFSRNVRKLLRNIRLGKPVPLDGPMSERWKQMARIALGQSKMVVRPIAGVMHVIVYLGFIIINIEVLEIIIDGLLGTHRVFAFLGPAYDFLIGAFEVLALLVVVAVVVFWLRRNVVKIGRFWKPEMKGWPKRDADWILYIELILMGLFLTMNAADFRLQALGADHYVRAGAFPVSSYVAGWMTSLPEATSHSRAVRSRAPVRRVLPSGENASAVSVAV